MLILLKLTSKIKSFAVFVIVMFNTIIIVIHFSKLHFQPWVNMYDRVSL